jgi:deazaflavin-dependent oxidoreductase (nitroreductase family)
MSWWTGGQFISTKTGSALWRTIAAPIEASILTATRGCVRLSVGVPIFVLTSIGAHTGMRGQTPLAYFTNGDDVILIASNYGGERHPAWYHNLLAHPQCELHIGPLGGPFVAREVDGADRDRLYALAVDRLNKGVGSIRAVNQRDQNHPNHAVDTPRQLVAEVTARPLAGIEVAGRVFNCPPTQYVTHSLPQPMAGPPPPPVHNHRRLPRCRFSKLILSGDADLQRCESSHLDAIGFRRTFVSYSPTSFGEPPIDRPHRVVWLKLRVSARGTYCDGEFE